MPFTFQAAIGIGYQTFKARYGSLLAASAIVVLVVIGVSFLEGYVATAESAVLLLLTYVLLNGPLWTGLALLAVCHVRGADPDSDAALKTLFAGFTRYWPLVGICALLMLIQSVPAVLFLILTLGGFGWVSPDIEASLIFNLPFICYTLFFSVRLMFAPVLCLDPRHQLGIRESFVTSWKLTAPVFWPLLGLLLAGLLFAIMTVILFVLPLILLGLPLVIAIMAAAYVLITGAPVAQPPAARPDTG